MGGKKRVKEGASVKVWPVSFPQMGAWIVPSANTGNGHSPRPDTALSVGPDSSGKALFLTIKMQENE